MSAGLRVLVCGSRTYPHKHYLEAMLDAIHEFEGISVVIEGEAEGADSLAREWAEERNITVEKYPADWKRHGRSAGPIRNKIMLQQGRPDLVVAFTDKPLHSSRGTANMVRISEEAGVPVTVYESPVRNS